jgi:hypothetical protein
MFNYKMNAIVLDQFKAIMLKEIKKFFVVYNQLCIVKNKNTICIDSYEYSNIIRVLGNYILKFFKKDTWITTRIDLDNNVNIDMSLFKDTKYQESVENFLLSLEKAFYSNADKEIFSYLETTTDFSPEEKDICLDFFKRLSALTKSMQFKNFSDIENDIGSNENIKGYHDELKDFHEFTLNTASDQNKFLVIERFDKVIKDILSKREHTVIFFNDFN